MIGRISKDLDDRTYRPLVSVVVPTYDREEQTICAVKSVLNQSLQDFEIIVVDDGSDKGCVRAALSALKHDRIHLFRHPERRGGATARNTGIDNARGRFIAFLDSDDIWLDNKLERQTDFHLALDNPHNYISYTGIVYYDGSKVTTMEFRPQEIGERLGDYLFLKWGKNFIQTSTMLLSRDLAHRIRFRDGLPIHQDWDFCLRAEQIGVCFKVLREPLTLVNAEARADRVSRAPDVNASLEWVESAKDLLSERAYVAFRAHQAPRLAHHSASGAIAMMVQAFLQGAIGPRESLVLLRWWAREFMISRPYLRDVFGWYEDARSLLGAKRQYRVKELE